MIRTFESYYSYDRLAKTDEMFNKIDKIYQDGQFMNVQVLGGAGGIMQVAKTGEYVNFTIFGDNYQFRINDWKDLDIFGRITDDKSGRSRYEAQLDDEEFYNVYKHVMIAIQFMKVNDLVQPYEGPKRREIFQRFETFFYNYSQNPDTFYKEYVEFFKDEPFYLAVVEWDEEKMKDLTEEEKNLVNSVKGGEKYKLFESKSAKEIEVFQLIENLYVEKNGGNFGTFVILSGIFEIWKEDEPDCYGFHVFYEAYSVCSNQVGEITLGHSSYPMKEEEIDKLIKNIKILTNFKKLYQMRGTHDTKQMSKELLNFFDGAGYNDENDPEEFYGLYYDYFKDHPEYLAIVDFPQEVLNKDFTEPEKNNIKSSHGGSKYKLFGESMKGINKSILEVSHKNFYNYLLSLSEKYPMPLDVLGGYLVIDFDVQKFNPRIFVTLTLGGSDYCVTWDDKLRYYYGDPQNPQEEVTDLKEVEELKESIDIMLNFVGIEVDDNDENSMILFNYISNMFTNAKNFYSKFVNTFKSQPEILKYIKWDDEKMKGFTEEEKNLLRSVMGGSKYKIFGESLNEEFDYAKFLDDLHHLEHWMNLELRKIQVGNVWLSFNMVLSTGSSNYKDAAKDRNPDRSVKHFPFRTEIKSSELWQHFDTVDEYTNYIHKIDELIKKNVNVVDSKLMETRYIEYLVAIDDKVKNIITSMKTVDKYQL